MWTLRLHLGLHSGCKWSSSEGKRHHTSVGHKGINRQAGGYSPHFVSTAVTKYKQKCTFTLSFIAFFSSEPHPHQGLLFKKKKKKLKSNLKPLPSKPVGEKKEIVLFRSSVIKWSKSWNWLPVWNGPIIRIQNAGQYLLSYWFCPAAYFLLALPFSCKLTERGGGK